MIKVYRYISTVKAREPKDRQPTHYLKAKENQGDQEEKGVFVASLWTKEAKIDGVAKKWLSGEMKASWTNQTNPEENREGYVIVSERELKDLVKRLKELEGDEEPEKVADDELNADDIGF